MDSHGGPMSASGTKFTVVVCIVIDEELCGPAGNGAVMFVVLSVICLIVRHLDCFHDEGDPCQAQTRWCVSLMF